MLRIYAEQARQRQLSTLKQYQADTSTVEEIFPQRLREPQTRDRVAEAIGLGSGKQWDKLEKVAQARPDLLSQIRPGGMSIGKAHQEVKVLDSLSEGDNARCGIVSQLPDIDVLSYTQFETILRILSIRTLRLSCVYHGRSRAAYLG